MNIIDIWQKWMTNYNFVVVVRLCLAALYGGILGFERTGKMRAAGLRTYMLVSLGSAMTILTGIHLLNTVGSVDVSRIASSVVSGIGFIGAGTIMVSGIKQIKGLTTAAGIWVAACMGLAVGSGLYLGAFVMVLITILIMMAGGVVEGRYLQRRRKMNIYVMLDDKNYVVPFAHAVQNMQYEVRDFSVSRGAGGSVGVTFSISLPKGLTHKEVLTKIRGIKGVAIIQEL